MGQVAVDFGTGNTVVARFNATTERAETIAIPGITAEMRYRLGPGQPEQVVTVVPSLIHYGERETLIGDQVASRGLADHPDTMRWMKRGIAQRVTRRKRTSQGHKSPAQAGEDFLATLLQYASLQYASDRLSLPDDEFTFTAPVEAFEHFEDWLRRVCERVGIQRVRLLDEPTASVLGYHGVARRDDRFLVFDFGCGTLDVSTVRVDLGSSDHRKATQLGEAGCDLGGLDIDRWLSDDFCGRHGLDDHGRRALEAVILRVAEQTKIALSDPAEADATMSVLDDRAGAPRVLHTVYTRTCPDCERGRPGGGRDPRQGCFGCLLLAHGFLQTVRETLDRALENAAVKAGVRRDDLAKVVVTGGTSLVPCVRALLETAFDGRVDYASPFDAVARGACRGDIRPILQHDYSVESYDREKKDYEFLPLFRLGTEFPTPPDAPRRLWARGTCDGMTRIGLRIFEVSRMRRRTLDLSMVDAEGALRDDSCVTTDFAYVCLNRDNPTFIVADPPVDLARDQKRFLCAFWVDGNRRLLVSVRDTLTGRELLRDHPVVRL